MLEGEGGLSRANQWAQGAQVHRVNQLEDNKIFSLKYYSNFSREKVPYNIRLVFPCFLQFFNFIKLEFDHWKHITLIVGEI